MSKLVRARVKAVEYWPDWAKCCERPLHLSGDDSPEFTVDLEKQRDGDEGTCSNCGGWMPEGRDVWALADANGPAAWVALELIDLDEVPAELQSDKYVDSTAERIGG